MNRKKKITGDYNLQVGRSAGDGTGYKKIDTLVSYYVTKDL